MIKAISDDALASVALVIGLTDIAISVALRVPGVLKGDDAFLVQRGEDTIQSVAVRQRGPGLLLGEDSVPCGTNQPSNLLGVELAGLIHFLAEDFLQSLLRMETAADEKSNFALRVGCHLH